ncbi:PspA/IM30 family protein [Acidisarcina polymorpha]|uniref:PspA/IM30 family protein n=1 Tax=Acidisarcina polymorpha TaxID=2211140 RepID=A0A2Z5G7L9_9BACT|nr:PspA/IM30 family protein [Acidisarcina polymorpha]AXC14807.1 PspA/IM30 family protein [Acidisarcina polymorpha]
MFRRLSNLFYGFVGLFISGLERQNPEALLEVEQENLRKQIGKFNSGLAAHAGLVERLIAQVRKLETEDNELHAKTSANLKMGNRQAAGQYALRLQTVERELAENRKQMEQAETTYKELVRARDVAISIARQKIESLKSGLSDLKMKRAMAEITEMASGMVTDLGGSGETLNRLEEMVSEERHKAAGRVRVAVDSLDLRDVHIREAEQGALAEQALAAFEASQAPAQISAESRETLPSIIVPNAQKGPY